VELWAQCSIGSPRMARHDARILQFPPFVVQLAEEDEAWLVICREHGWLYGSRVEASADAMLIARSFDVPLVERSGGRS
jgi:hypothetical protein